MTKRTAWERVQLARHLARPHTLDYIAELLDEPRELHGDRLFRDDPAIVAAIGRFASEPVVVLGHQKGASTAENVSRNFGMPKPEGYRKAIRILQLAEKFELPVITFIDTPAADPGLESEERGQAWAISSCLQTLLRLRVPTLGIVIGEGGSGGALALAVCDRLLMLENAIFAVASPEACAAILWREAARAPDAAETMRITAEDLYHFGIADEVIPEPVPAHLDAMGVIRRVGSVLERHLSELLRLWQERGPEHLRRLRWARYRAIGVWSEEAISEPSG
ncbi:acetyl-CoA carboxylase carboxyltransferase subunit alpha [Thermomicrobium sp. 4228-Ro]|uniref:acetyl-CoA carboxylase carboxyltransferase subunit alpha n=1 Tax=Thermomicrobium sp. 4228-Ro TaxID=2993937 RepID=UPI002248BA8B|nr:acetyl-CoA carboxylase carboxyltransferase subunit alpha [Thermomicrobium sp. 4228-Ro]MCX2727472.1 acetyl-CoA carboxylase carboxyltransferase subunit alpha [Thermomicrobium sp. 4228-Ro]